MQAILGKGMCALGVCEARRSKLPYLATVLKNHALTGAINTFALEALIFVLSLELFFVTFFWIKPKESK